MSIFKLNPLDIENFALQVNPNTHYVSSSSGITGAIRIFPRNSHIIKDDASYSAVTSSAFSDDASINSAIADLEKAALTETPGVNISGVVGAFTKSIHDRAQFDPYMVIDRYVPLYTDLSGSSLKSTVANVLMPRYKHTFNNCEMSCVNYNSLNFVSGVGAGDAVLIYSDYHYNFLRNVCTLNFNINIRHTADPTSFRPGTLLHLPNSFAISVISGSSRNQLGNIDKYRLMLQLGDDAAPTINPESAAPLIGTSSTYLSDDNLLKVNHWHNVQIKWPLRPNYNGTGSIIVDDLPAGNFSYPESVTGNQSQTLFLGNYYESSDSYVLDISKFFSVFAANSDGVAIKNVSTTEREPISYTLKYPGFFELHDVSVFNSYLTSALHSTYTDSNCVFYVTPAFSASSHQRTKSSPTGVGGIILSPSFGNYSRPISTTAPFNISLSNGCGAHYLNLENYLQDSVTCQQPRLLNLSGTSNRAVSYGYYDVNDYFYATSSVALRNLTILPCDDGNFSADISLLGAKEKIDLSQVVSGSGMMPSQAALLNVKLTSADPNTIFENAVLNDYKANSDLSSDEILNIPYNPYLDAQQEVIASVPGLSGELLGFNPINPSWKLGTSTSNWFNKAGLQDTEQPTAMYWRTLDKSSNQVVLFNISNLFYGDRILPGSFTMRDASLTGSQGKVSVTLKDDGQGGLYRADSITPNATFNTAGNIFYEQGLVILKNPSLYFFGKDQFEIKFKGDRNVHVTKLEALAPKSAVNTSTNSSYMFLSASADQIDRDKPCVYINGINFHDDNLNVVARARLAQPILKRESSAILFRCKLDF